VTRASGEARGPGSRHDRSVRGEQTYRFIVRGPGVDRLVDAIEATVIRTQADQTVLTARIEDQSHLRGVLNSIGDFGLQLVGFERLVRVPPSSASRAREL
jgi:hypothetical protein